LGRYQSIQPHLEDTTMPQSRWPSREESDRAIAEIREHWRQQDLLRQADLYRLPSTGPAPDALLPSLSDFPPQVQPDFHVSRDAYVYRVNDPRTYGSPEAEQRTRAIFGETSGLYPQRKDPNGGPTDPTNFDPESFAQLQRARTHLSDTAMLNDKHHWAYPTPNPIDQQAWSNAADAARMAMARKNPNPGANFYLRQGGDWTTNQNPTPRPGYLKPRNLIEEYGPFHNVGGGDVARGPNAFVEVYGPDRRKR
jgi:hypothetical protein